MTITTRLARLARLERAANPPSGGDGGPDGSGCPVCRGWEDGAWLLALMMDPDAKPDACPGCGRRPRKERVGFSLFDVLRAAAEGEAA